jgi:hypothetical protein
MSYDEHLITQAGGNGDDFPCCSVTFPEPLEPGHIRTQDFTLDELFPDSRLVKLNYGAWCCTECSALVNDQVVHVAWHNKLLP